MTKAELRAIYKKKRMDLSEPERNALEEKILNELLLKLHDLEHIGIFLPIEKFREIDLTPLLRQTEFNWYAPVSNFADNSMHFAQLRHSSDFEVSAHGIPEPLSQNFIQPEALDAVVVPMLISDRAGFRVGYGKGFYDNFLKLCRPDCKRIGVNYFAPIEKIDDVEAHDEALEICIYPGQC